MNVALSNLFLFWRSLWSFVWPTGQKHTVLILSKTSHKTKVQQQSGFRQDMNWNDLECTVENDANAKVDADVLKRL